MDSAIVCNRNEISKTITKDYYENIRVFLFELNLNFPMCKLVTDHIGGSRVYVNMCGNPVQIFRVIDTWNLHLDQIIKLLCYN